MRAPRRHGASWCAAGWTRPSAAGWGRASWTRACPSSRRPGRRCAPWRTWPGSCPGAWPCSGTRPPAWITELAPEVRAGLLKGLGHLPGPHPARARRGLRRPAPGARRGLAPRAPAALRAPWAWPGARAGWAGCRPGRGPDWSLPGPGRWPARTASRTWAAGWLLWGEAGAAPGRPGAPGSGRTGRGAGRAPGPGGAGPQPAHRRRGLARAPSPSSAGAPAGAWPSWAAGSSSCPAVPGSGPRPWPGSWPGTWSGALRCPIHLAASDDLAAAGSLGQQAMWEGLPWRNALPLPPALPCFTPGLGADPREPGPLEARSGFPAPMARALGEPPAVLLRVPGVPMEGAVKAFLAGLDQVPAIRWLPPDLAPPGPFLPGRPWAPAKAFPPLAEPAQVLQPDCSTIRIEGEGAGGAVPVERRRHLGPQHEDGAAVVEEQQGGHGAAQGAVQDAQGGGVLQVVAEGDPGRPPQQRAHQPAQQSVAERHVAPGQVLEHQGGQDQAQDRGQPVQDPHGPHRAPGEQGQVEQGRQQRHQAHQDPHHHRQAPDQGKPAGSAGAP